MEKIEKGADAGELLMIDHRTENNATDIQRLISLLALTMDQLTREQARRRKAEDHLRECEERLGTITNSMLAGIIIVDPETHVIIDANAAALRLVNAPGQEIVGRVCHRFICPAEQGRCPITDLGERVDCSERVMITSAGRQVPVIKTVTKTSFGGNQYLVEMFIDISARKQAEAAQEHLIVELRQALASVKTLKGLLPICASCKKIRNDQGYWHQIEAYIETHTDAAFTHGICPDCMKELYPEYARG